MHTSVAQSEILSGKPWIQIDLNETSTLPKVLSIPQLELLKPPNLQCCFSFEAFKLSGLGGSEIKANSLGSDEIEIFRDQHKKQPKQVKSTERLVVFLKIDSALRDELLHRDISLFPKEGILPKELSSLIKKIGIGEERLVRVVNLSATARYTSEQDKFNSFCIPEHSIVTQDLDQLNRGSENQATRIFRTHLVDVIYNQSVTLVISDGSSPTVNQLAGNLRDGRLEYVKPADKMPCVTTLLKDIVEANCIACQRVLRTFHQFKVLPFKAHDTTVVAAFKMVLAELQNYWVTEADPVSGMEKLLTGIKKDSEGLRTLLNKPSRFNELLEDIQLTTQKALQLDRGLTLREDARRAGVESRSQYISATLAALGSAFLPNATVTQLPLAASGLQWAAHGVATFISLCLLLRMRRLGWFDFVTENFGDLFGLGKLKNFFKSRNK